MQGFWRAAFLVSAELVLFVHTMNNSTEGGRASRHAVVYWPSRQSQGIAYVAALVVEALFIIIGNLVVLAVFGKNRRLRQRKSHWLLVSQAVADLLAGLIVVPLSVFYIGGHNFVLWHIHTDFSMIVGVNMKTELLTFASLFNLLMIALERTYATFRPTKHRVISARNYRVAIVVVWFLPVLLPICPCVAEYLKIISLSTHFYIQACSGCGIFLLVVSSYASLWIKLKRSSIAPQNDLRAARERKLTASVFLITAASFGTYVPGLIVLTIAQAPHSKIGMSFYSTSHAMMCGFLLVCANFLINPIIYSYKMPELRRAAIRLICRNRHRTRNAVLPLEAEEIERRDWGSVSQYSPCTFQLRSILVVSDHGEIRDATLLHRLLFIRRFITRRHVHIFTLHSRAFPWG